MSRYLNPEALAALPLGSVVVVKWSNKPRIMIKLAPSRWSMEGFSDDQVAGMSATLREVVQATPPDLRVIPGFRRDTRARMATQRREQGSSTNDSAAGHHAAAG